MSSGTAQRVVEDFYGVIQLRSSATAPSSVVTNPPSCQQGRSRTCRPSSGRTPGRLHKPSPPTVGDEGNKFPMLVYFHGGGYCVGAYDQLMFHSFCQ